MIMHKEPSEVTPVTPMPNIQVIKGGKKPLREVLKSLKASKIAAEPFGLIFERDIEIGTPVKLDTGVCPVAVNRIWATIVNLRRQQEIENDAKADLRDLKSWLKDPYFLSVVNGPTPAAAVVWFMDYLEAKYECQERDDDFDD